MVTDASPRRRWRRAPDPEAVAGARGGTRAANKKRGPVGPRWEQSKTGARPQWAAVVASGAFAAAFFRQSGHVPKNSSMCVTWS